MRFLTVGNMYPPHHQGGYERVWHSWVEHARGAGHDVAALTSDHREPGEHSLDPPYVRRDLRWYWRDHEFPASRPAQRFALERHNSSVLHAALAAQRPDAVLWWALGGLSLSLVGQVARAGVPALGVVHDAWPAYGPQVDAWIAMWARRPALARAMAAVTRIPTRFDPGAVTRWSANSAHIRDLCRAQPGWEAADVRVDHPGIDAAAFAAAPPAPQFGWRLACVGRVEARKGVDTAIEALALLGADATLTVTGGGDSAHVAALRVLAHARGVAARVTLAGPAAGGDVRGAYAAADVVLFPVRWEEPFGLVPLEAMAVGRPVIATGTGGSGEYLRDGDNALLVPPGDADALARAVARLAGDGALRERLRAGGRATAARFVQTGFDKAILRHAVDVADSH